MKPQIPNLKFQIFFSLLLGCLYAFTESFLSPVYAQTNGIEVSPSSVQLDFATDRPQTTLLYTNHTNQTVLLTFSASDVTELEDSYRVTFLEQKNAQNYKYGLSSWITFSNSSLLLNPGEKGSITIFIDKDKLSTGGHYGSILAHIQQAPGQGNVTINSVLATLIFVRTHTGKEYEKGQITTFAPEQNFFDFPQNLLLRFTNNGDTYVVPYGRALVYDMFGNTVAQGIVNTGSLLVLPESLRRLEIPLQPSTKILLPGMYHATISMHFGKTNQQLSSTVSFFSFGTLPVIQVLLGIILIAVAAYFFRRKQESHTFE